jgi:hypothetical protein
MNMRIRERLTAGNIVCALAILVIAVMMYLGIVIALGVT